MDRSDVPDFYHAGFKR